MPKRAARVITAAFSESSESDDSDDEKASEDSDSEQEVEVVTTVSGTPLASSSSSGTNVGGKRSAKYLKELYKKSGRRVTCLDCKKSGIPEAQVTGRQLSIFGVQHSRAVHENDERHSRGLALFPFRETKRSRVDREIVAREKALATDAGSKPAAVRSAQTSITAFTKPVSKDPRKDLRRAIAKTIIKLKIAPNALPVFQDLVNAACSYGSESRFVSFDLGRPQSFVESAIEGESGLLGDVVAEITSGDSSSRDFSAAMQYGVGLAMDSARDVNSRCVMPILAMTWVGAILVAMTRPDGRSKNAQWMVESLRPLLNGTYAVSTQETASSSTGRRLSSATACEQLTMVANHFSKRVFFLSGDHASAEVAAMAKLQELEAVLPTGDPSHAIHNTGKHLVRPFSAFLTSIHNVANFFRNHTGPKELLRGKALLNNAETRSRTYTTLRNDVETRFLSSYVMVLSFSKVIRPLKDVVNSTAFEEWVDAHPDAADEADRVAETIKATKTPLLAEFILALLLPLVKMCRFFDAARVGSLCFVYPFWSLLNESVLASIANPKFATIVTPNVVDHIKRTLLHCWNRFDFDAYGAAYVLNPYFHADVMALNLAATQSRTDDDDDEEFDEPPVTPRSQEFHDLFEQTIRVLLSMVRRFPPQVGATARDQVLSEDHPKVQRTLEKIREELTAYVADPGRGRKWDASQRAQGTPCLLPGQIWFASPPSYLKAYAMMLVSAVAGSTEVERLHWCTGRTRTAPRNLLGYVRNHGLVFLDRYLNSRAVVPSTDFAACMWALEANKLLSDEDELFLEAMETRITEQEQSAREAEDDAAETGRELLVQVQSDADSDGEQPAPPSEQLGRGRRAASSRFYAMLESERRRGREQSDSEEESEDPDSWEDA